VSEEVGRERLIHEGTPDGQKTESCKSERQSRSPPKSIVDCSLGQDQPLLKFHQIPL